MKPLTKLLIIGNLLALFGYLGYSITQKETLLTDGDLVLLALAPVDPRSLMQGDYMELNYAIARGRSREVEHKRGYVVVELDADGVGQYVRLQPDRVPLAAGEYLVNYQKSDWSLDVGAGSFFFQEGRAEDFEAARYGGLRIDNEGNSLLVGLYDKDRQLIK